MKRGAERQITKGEGEDEPEVEVNPALYFSLYLVYNFLQEVSGDSAFHKADDAILATRKLAAILVE
jgi:hypothetical protein